MKKKITLTISISSRDYFITVDDEEFARFLESDLGGFLGGRKILSPKELLDAYVQKCSDAYDDERIEKELIKDIDKCLNTKR